MSISRERESDESPVGEPDSASGFRFFWKKQDKNIGLQTVQFIPQDPGSKRKSHRLSRLLRHGSSPLANTESSDGGSENSNENAAQKRRQQVYQAQKRHRNRKAEYVQSLEAEITRLQHLDSIVNNERNALAHENLKMRAILAQHSIDTGLESLHFSDPSFIDDLSMLESAAIDIRVDSDIGQERIFMDFDDVVDMLQVSDKSHQIEEQTRQQIRKSPVKGDSWAALDFILALEWPCRNHIQHHSINPEAKIPKACDLGQFHGHALTATQAVFSSALPPPQTSHEHTLLDVALQPQHGLHNNTMDRWQLPHSEIDKLVELSEQLQLDDQQLTPSQAYAAIRQEISSDEMLRPVLEALKVPLAGIVQCLGFGAVMETPLFYMHLDSVLSALNLAKPA
ncbi:MAG: hypothetical protein FE78DRAFT_31082 [Acidomyces sp. 'richmondensis']|nr:MAG: hypothetical protein FE78DRAFT_31082 [Acidomyces sp. 'richmondensis']